MKRIRELREQKGLEQKHLAIDLGVSQPTVSDWESGRKTPSAKRMQLIADYFNVSIDYLLSRSDDPSPINGQKKTADEESAEEYLRRLLIERLQVDPDFTLTDDDVNRILELARIAVLKDKDSGKI